MDTFEEKLIELAELAAFALLGAENHEKAATLQLEIRHTVLHEVLGLYNACRDFEIID